MSESYIQNLFAERIGGKNYGKSTAIYKFEKIKRARRAAIAAHPGVEVIDVGLGHPPMQGRLRDIEIDAHLGQDRARPTSDRHEITVELRREPLGHRNILPETHGVP